jgi:protein disulfide isomerase
MISFVFWDFVFIIKKMLALLLYFLNLSASHDLPAGDNLIVLTDSNFNEAIKTNDFLIVMFYAPWCGQCLTLMPQLSKAAEKFQGVMPLTKFAKIDSIANEETFKQYKIRGFPTIIAFKYGRVTQYTGQLVDHELVNWVSKQMQNNFTFATSEEQLRILMENDPKVLVAYTPKPSEEFLQAAKSTFKLDYVVVLDPALATAMGEVFGSTVLYWSMRRVVFEPHNYKLTDWIAEQTKTWALDFSEDTAQIVHDSGKPAMFFFRSSSQAKALSTMIEEAAENVKDDVSVVVADLESVVGRRLEVSLGVTADMMPCSMIVEVNDGVRKYVDCNAVSVSSIRTFVDNWREHKLQPFFKSAQEPAEPYDGAVKTLVANTFEKEVKGGGDVVVLFYVPVSEACMELLETMKEAAEHFRGNNSVLFAKVDISLNEIEQTHVKTLPEIQFFGRSETKPELYIGEKTAKALIEFVMKHQQSPSRPERTEDL